MNGASVGARCLVCRSGKVGSIDALVRAGTRTLKDIAADHGVPYSALRRHAANHVAPSTSGSPAAAGTTMLPAGATPYDTMRKRVDDLNAMDSTTMSSRDRIAHANELRLAAESLAKLTPVDPDLGTIDPMSVPGVGEILAMIFEATDPTRGIVIEDTSDPVAVAVARGRVMERAAFRTKITEWRARYAAAEEGA